MKHPLHIGLAAIVALSAFVLPGAYAQTPERGAVPEQHDSNTLHKLGKAVQYPVRKAGENVSKTGHKAGKDVQYPVRKTGENISVGTHQVTGKNSVVRRRHKKANRVVTPTGKVYTMPQAKKKGLAKP